MIAFISYDPSERGTIATIPEGSTGDAPLLTVHVIDLDAGAITDVPTRVATDWNGVGWGINGTLLVNRWD